VSAVDTHAGSSFPTAACPARSGEDENLPRLAVSLAALGRPDPPLVTTARLVGLTARHNRLMLRSTRHFLVLAAALGASSVSGDPVGDVTSPRAVILPGTWVGEMEHDGDRQTVALHFDPPDSGRVLVRLSLPVIHLDAAPIGRMRVEWVRDSMRVGPFRFRFDASDSSLSGVMPAAVVPAYRIPFTLHRVRHFAMPQRDTIPDRKIVPAWSYDVGSPLWAGPTLAGHRLYAGAEDGTLHALDARTGKRRWTYRTGGAIRTRPVESRGALFFQADDGFLYKLDAENGRLAWRTRIVDEPIERLPFDDPKSRYDRFGSDAAIGDRWLFIGTHDGKLLAIDPSDGSRIWTFHAGEAVLSAPTVANGRVWFGCFNGLLFALDAVTGQELWRLDTRGAVVSTPALDGGRVIIGNRAYDLLGVDAVTGTVDWKRYIWMSWVESSATVKGGVAYVGSSDAAAVFAFETAGGRRLWSADVRGWSWGQPAVTETRVYAGTSSQVGYLAQHAGGILALDRSTGRVLWRYAAPVPDSGAYGFPGSPAVGEGLVFATGLDGRIIALPR